MPTPKARRLRLAAATTLVGLTTLTGAGAASAAPLRTAQPAAQPAAGTNLLTDGSLTQPGTEGAVPAGWALTNLDNETAPYTSTNITQYDGTGKYPPPAGTPTTSGYATEDYYAAGSATGSEGVGGQQTSATFGSVTQADNPQVSFATAETSAPSTSVASWAGSVLQVVVASGGSTYTLRYFDPWTPATGTYSGAPANSPSTKYVTGPTLTSKTWTTNPTRSLSADLNQQFGITTYSVSSVLFGNLEGTTSNGGSAGPYPNMTSYFANLGLVEGSSTTVPPSSVPESPAIIDLPLAAAALIGGGLLLRRKRHHAR